MSNAFGYPCSFFPHLKAVHYILQSHTFWEPESKQKKSCAVIYISLVRLQGLNEMSLAVRWIKSPASKAICHMLSESHSLSFNMQDIIRVDFIQKLWQSQYQMEKKWSNKLLQLHQVGNGASAQGNRRQINFIFLIKTVEYFYAAAFIRQISTNCVINIK